MSDNLEILSQESKHLINTNSVLPDNFSSNNPENASVSTNSPDHDPVLNSIEPSNDTSTSNLPIIDSKESNTSIQPNLSEIGETNDKISQEPQAPVVKEFVIDLNTVSEEEKKANSEYFPGTSAKTPERYMKVRNAILDCWKKNPTVYLSKQACRKEHTGLGCVNALGRIHSYLESVNAINVGFPPKAPRNVGPRATSSKSAQPKRSNSLGALYNDLSEDDSDYVGNRLSSNGSSRRSTRKKVKNYNEQVDAEDSPFSLVEPSFFTQSNPAPFKVFCDPLILAICDFHSHLCWTEVIGLLGGKYDQESSTLTISSVFPCNGMSSDIECEMDPASEMEAREYFASLGLSVVGWYHSHPTFCSHPSMRDIETQYSYQTLFKLENDVEPFIGLIISPFENSDLMSVNSNIQALTIFPFGSYVDHRLPFHCDLEKIDSTKETLPLHIFEELLQRYAYHERKVHLNKAWSKKAEMTYYEKMLLSVQSHFEGMNNNFGDLKAILDAMILTKTSS